MPSSDPYDDDDYDRPRRRGRDDEDDDNEDRRRAYDERDDFDDYPGRRSAGDGLGITSMILGIISCVMALGGLCCIVFPGISLLMGVTAVILGFVARSQRSESGPAKAGIITGFVGIGLSVLLFVLVIVLQFGMAMAN